jgi:type IV pilus assembly protein PilM
VSLGATGLGLDIGSSLVQMMQLRAAGDRIDIEAAGVFSHQGDVGTDGVVTDPGRLGKALAEHLERHRISATSAVFSIPSHLASLRWVTLPDLESAELREAARFKVRRHLPFPIDSAYVEATPPEVQGEESSGLSLVIVVRKDVVDSRAEALEEAGLLPLAAELEAQAVLRVVERKLNQQSPLWRDASVTIIDLGSSNTHMYVVQNRQLQFMRGIKFGSDRIARTVASQLDIDFEQAGMLVGCESTEVSPEGVLRMDVNEQPVIVNVRQDLDKLNLEFLRLLRYFRSLHPERSYAGILDHVIVCGGLAGVKGIPEFLEAVLGLRVERARPFAGMVGQFDRQTFENIVSRQEAFAVALGLALAGLESENKKGAMGHASREFVWSR